MIEKEELTTIDEAYYWVEDVYIEYTTGIECLETMYRLGIEHAAEEIGKLYDLPIKPKIKPRVLSEKDEDEIITVGAFYYWVKEIFEEYTIGVECPQTMYRLGVEHSIEELADIFELPIKLKIDKYGDDE